ncbi:unnamed protein product [Allacma fusca]|uniref:RDD domain-containing protein n=1 Tax=Allacma fusca TaxID=39272 RepID=A0A8J2KGJ3_9HEXA|nr:unnamed protein product [Allacma fusca]
MSSNKCDTETADSSRKESSNCNNKESSNNGSPPPSMTEYCQSLETWLNNVYIQRACATSAYYTAYSILFGNNLVNVSQFSNQSNVEGVFNLPRAAGGNLPNRDFYRAAAVPQQYPDTLRIAPIWKRLLAEVFDFLVLLIVKVFVTLSIIENFELIDFDSIDIDLIQDSGSIYDIAISLTSELILLEFIHRIVVCFFEAYCLAKNGCTPGKSLLRLRVVHCETIQEVNHRLVITPGVPLSFPRALLRSFIKNFSIALFFPMCFTLLHFDNSQTIYDHISKSIVVAF